MSTGRKIFATAQIVNGEIVIDLGDTANYMTVKGSEGIIFIVERNSKEFVEVKDRRYENENLMEEIWKIFHMIKIIRYRE